MFMRLLHPTVKCLGVRVITQSIELVSLMYFLCAKEVLEEVEKELEHINPERATKNAPENIENNSFRGRLSCMSCINRFG